jgi:hypothetical protein
MADVTAQIIVGGVNPWGGGIKPTHMLWLSENGRSAWQLQPRGRDIGGWRVDELPEERLPSWTTEEIVWVPDGPDNILEDGILMIAIHVLRDAAVVDLASTLLPVLLEERFNELEKMSDESLLELRDQCRKITMDYKLVVTVLEHSSLGEQLDRLEGYAVEVEVCTVTFARFWTGPWGQHDGAPDNGLPQKAGDRSRPARPLAGASYTVERNRRGSFLECACPRLCGVARPRGYQR